MRAASRFLPGCSMALGLLPAAALRHAGERLQLLTRAFGVRVLTLHNEFAVYAFIFKRAAPTRLLQCDRIVRT